MQGIGTFVFKEIAHASASGKNKLRDVFDDLRFLLGGESSEPFGKSLNDFNLISLSEIAGWVTAGVAYHFPLPRQQDEVAVSCRQHTRTSTRSSQAILYGHLAGAGFGQI